MAWRLEDFTLPHIEKDLNDILANASFKPFRGGQWVRYWGWKSDHLYITIDTKTAFSFNCQVWAAPWPEEEDLAHDRSFDVTTLPVVPPEPEGEFKVPKLPIFLAPFRKKVVEAVSASLGWFDRCDTPRKSLAVMKARPYENLASPAAMHLARYVAFLPSDLENIACLILPPAPIHQKYERDLFIPPSQRRL